jgi:predicted RNA-binding protein with PIN domain
VARRGLTDEPPVVPPAGLRRYLGFTRLSTAALQAIARVVDSDDAFRARVAAAVDEDEVGRAGWLWLARPDGYLDEIELLEKDAASAAAADAEDREERDARRRLAAAQAAADRATEAARAQARETDDLRGELADERSRRAAAEVRIADLDAELAQLRAERARAVRELKDVESRLVERSVEARQTKARLREIEDELAAGGPAEPKGPPAVARRSPPAMPSSPLTAPIGYDRAVEADEPSDDDVVQPATLPPVPIPSEPAIDVAALAEAVQLAAHGAGELARALSAIEAVVAALHPIGEEPSVGHDDHAGVARTVGPSAVPDGAGAASERVPRPRRVPLALPGGLLDDSVEAVEHLLRAPGVLLLVDGYNVTMTGWPELPVGEQRRRLLGALGETAARTGAAVEVVFDGADVEPLSVPRQVRQMVRVRFSPPDIEADDVVLDLLAQLPVARPVAVASSDNRVRDGARRLGANLVHARQLVNLLRR